METSKQQLIYKKVVNMTYNKLDCKTVREGNISYFYYYHIGKVIDWVTPEDKLVFAYDYSKDAFIIDWKTVSNPYPDYIPSTKHDYRPYISMKHKQLLWYWADLLGSNQVVEYYFETDYFINLLKETKPIW